MSSERFRRQPPLADRQSGDGPAARDPPGRPPAGSARPRQAQTAADSASDRSSTSAEGHRRRHGAQPRGRGLPGGPWREPSCRHESTGRRVLGRQGRRARARGDPEPVVGRPLRGGDGPVHQRPPQAGQDARHRPRDLLRAAALRAVGPRLRVAAPPALPDREDDVRLGLPGDPDTGTRVPRGARANADRGASAAPSASKQLEWVFENDPPPHHERNEPGPISKRPRRWAGRLFWSGRASKTATGPKAPPPSPQPAGQGASGREVAGQEAALAAGQLIGFVLAQLMGNPFDKKNQDDLVKGIAALEPEVVRRLDALAPSVLALQRRGEIAHANVTYKVVSTSPAATPGCRRWSLSRSKCPSGSGPASRSSSGRTTFKRGPETHGPRSPSSHGRWRSGPSCSRRLHSICTTRWSRSSARWPTRPPRPRTSER